MSFPSHALSSLCRLNGHRGERLSFSFVHVASKYVMAPNFHASKRGSLIGWCNGFTCFWHLSLFFLFLGCVYFCPSGYPKKKEVRYLALLGFLYLPSRVLVGLQLRKKTKEGEEINQSINQSYGFFLSKHYRRVSEKKISLSSLRSSTNLFPFLVLSLPIFPLP